MNSSSTSSQTPGSNGDGIESVEYDPVFVNSRREAILITATWICAMVWAVPYCYINGYPSKFDPQTFKTVWGVPAWVFWGIAVPWMIANVLTVFFCLFVMKDDDLEPAGGSDSAV